MRSVKSALVVLGSVVAVANLVIACSGDDRTDFVDWSDLDSGSSPSLPGTAAPTSTGTTPTPPPPKKDGGDEMDGGDEDNGDADSGTPVVPPDGGNEGGPTNPPGPDAGSAGSPCANANEVQQQSCGLCGVQYRLCAPTYDEDGGTSNTWHEWGYCQNELVDGCVPGTVTTEACGLCGTRQKVCQNDCRYAAGACKNEPANACVPGTVDFQEGLSCTQGGRQRTCEATCTYTPFGDCIVPPEPDVPSLTVSTTVGEKVLGDFALTASEKLPRLSGTCPNGDADNAERPSNWIKLINPGAGAVKVTVWTLRSTKPGNAVIDTVMASYGKTFPNTPAKREACVSGVNDGCSTTTAGDPTACLNSWAGLVGTGAVTIGANSHAYIWVGGWSDSSVGDYQLAARTDVVN